MNCGKGRAVLLLMVGLLYILQPVSVRASVFYTTEATGSADTVYVAGNPDWYPVEYYDANSQSYEGILPEILKQVGKETGLKFTYIQAGKQDQRHRLAKNGQVELVSGCSTEESWLQKLGIRTSETILYIPLDKGETKVCLAFSRIADEEMIGKVEAALAQLSPQQIAGLSARFAMEHPNRNEPHTVLLYFAIIGLLFILSIIQTFRLYRCKMTVQEDVKVDLLTGIKNKAGFTEFFNTCISDQYRNLYSVIYIGFDIVRVNQYYGEVAAEEQLCFAANELKLRVRENECVARVSGGGFAVARPCGGERDTELWLEPLLEQLNRYTERYGKDYRPNFEAGIYMLQLTDRDCETVLFNARQGYHRAIDTERPYAFARSDHLTRENEKLQLKKQMLEALQKREFLMFLQFIVRGTDGKICGAEAVSRWDHPQRGLLYPGSYIELMEAEGTVAELDFYIFEEVCRQMEQWHEEKENLIISCNFARITIGRKDFVRRVREIADRYTFCREKLVMEITEDAMEMDKDIAFSNILHCKEMGFLVALDDVGSGYTSFADLRDYPIDIVKIDRSLLNAAVTERGAALLRGIVALAHNLDMKVLGEGAETQGQVELLRKVGCDYIQGYFYYRPLPLAEAKNVLSKKSVCFEN